MSFSSPEPRSARELTDWQPVSSVSPLKLLCQSKLNFSGAARQRQKADLFVWMSLAIWDGPHAHIWHKTFKNLVLQNLRVLVWSICTLCFTKFVQWWSVVDLTPERSVLLPSTYILKNFVKVPIWNTFEDLGKYLACKLKLWCSQAMRDQVWPLTQGHLHVSFEEQFGLEES